MNIRKRPTESIPSPTKATQHMAGRILETHMLWAVNWASIPLPILDTLFERVTRMGLGMPEHPNLRHALGVTTKTTVHHWRQAGSAASGIPGYADNYVGIANVSKWMSRAGYVGLGFSAVSAYSNTVEACTSGREEECQRARIREGASFGGGLAGSAAGSVAGVVCLALGAPTGGMTTLACAVVMVGGV